MSNPFAEGLEKHAENWWKLFKKPFQMYQAAGKSPQHKVRRALALGTLGTAGAVYGVNKIIENPDDQMVGQAPGL